MPEGPEIEVVRRLLEPGLLGATITGITVNKPRMSRPHTTDALRQHVSGRQIQSWTRRGKYLVLGLGDTALILHLGMTGRLYLGARTAVEPAHTAAIIRINEDAALTLKDPRGFGRISTDVQLIEGIAPDPLSPEWSKVDLETRLMGSGRAVRDLLLDPRRIGGIGNIYANEALFVAGVHPALPGRKLTKRALPRLRQAMSDVFDEAVDFGMSLRLDLEGTHKQNRLFYFGTLPQEEKPAPKERFRVYGRHGALCQACLTPIEKMTLTGRSAFFCPKCQKPA